MDNKRSEIRIILNRVNGMSTIEVVVEGSKNDLTEAIMMTMVSNAHFSRMVMDAVDQYDNHEAIPPYTKHDLNDDLKVN